MNCTLVKNICVIHLSLWNHPLMVFGSHEYRPIYRIEASAAKAMRPILTRELLFPINSWDFVHAQYVALASSLWRLCHPGIIVLILSSRRILSFSLIWLCSRMYWRRIAAAAAAAAAFRSGWGLPASWMQRFPDASLKIHLRFNVVRISRALLVIFQHRLSKFSSFSRKDEPQFIIHDLSKFI